MGFIGDTVRSITNFLMVFGPVSGYVPQYFEIRKTGYAQGFSLYVSLILLLANILRLFFWLGSHFQLVLVYQAIAMIVCQLFLLEVCTRDAGQHSTNHQRFHPLRRSSYTPGIFWNWPDFGSFVSFLLFFSAIWAVVTYIFIGADWYVELLGYAALITESTLGMPQAYKNFRARSTAGLSYYLVFTWVFGDSFKFLWFIMNGAPFQFLACAVIQLTVDFTVTAQIFFYRKNTAAQNAVVGDDDL